MLKKRWTLEDLVERDDGEPAVAKSEGFFGGIHSFVTPITFNHGRVVRKGKEAEE